MTSFYPDIVKQLFHGQKGVDCKAFYSTLVNIPLLVIVEFYPNMKLKQSISFTLKSAAYLTANFDFRRKKTQHKVASLLNA